MASHTLLEQVKNAVLQYSEQQNGHSGSFDPKPLLTTLEDLFAQHQTNQSEPQGMDPYGGLPDEAGSTSKMRDPHSAPSD